jgi:hypothetical protein
VWVNSLIGSQSLLDFLQKTKQAAWRWACFAAAGGETFSGQARLRPAHFATTKVIIFVFPKER